MNSPVRTLSTIAVLVLSLSISRWETAPSRVTAAATPNTPVPAVVPSWTLTVVGDIMLDRNVWAKIKKYGPAYPYAKITGQLKGADVVLANLEGPFTDSKNHAVSGGSLLFNFESWLAPSLKQAGFTTLLLGNNHTLNQRQAGLDNTRAVLKKNKLEYFGDPKNRPGFTLTKKLGGKNVTFIGYDNLDGTIASVLAEVKAAHKRSNLVVVVPHWGAEYKLGIQPALQAQARQLIDAGADLIIGGHPHVVEPVEIYKGKFIAYSLGNFVFDQYFSTDTQRELMLKLKVSGKKLTITFIPLVSVGSQVRLADAAARQVLLDRIAKNSVVSTTQKSQIKKGVLTIAF